jgi:hypothetical protein
MFVSEEFLYTIDIRLFSSDLVIFGRNFQLIINTVSVILSESEFPMFYQCVSISRPNKYGRKQLFQKVFRPFDAGSILLCVNDPKL